MANGEDERDPSLPGEAVLQLVRGRRATEERFWAASKELRGRLYAIDQEPNPDVRELLLANLEAEVTRDELWAAMEFAVGVRRGAAKLRGFGL